MYASYWVNNNCAVDFWLWVARKISLLISCEPLKNNQFSSQHYARLYIQTKLQVENPASFIKMQDGLLNISFSNAEGTKDVQNTLKPLISATFIYLISLLSDSIVFIFKIHAIQHHTLIWCMLT